MRVFVAGASGAIGRRLVPQLIDAGHDVVGTYNSPSSAELPAEARRDPGRARPARCGRGAQGRARERAGGDRPPGDCPREREVLAEHGQGDGQDQRAADEGNGRPARRCAGGRRAPLRRAERRLVLPVRPRGRAGQERERCARPVAAGALPQERRRDGLPRAGRHRLRRDRAALRRLLRRGQRRHDRARAQAAVPDRRRRRRGLVVDPPGRRGLGHRARARTTTARRSSTSSTTIPRRCASGFPCSPTPSGRSRRGTSPPGSRGFSQARR